MITIEFWMIIHRTCNPKKVITQNKVREIYKE